MLRHNSMPSPAECDGRELCIEETPRKTDSINTEPRIPQLVLAGRGGCMHKGRLFHWRPLDFLLRSRPMPLLKITKRDRLAGGRWVVKGANNSNISKPFRA